MSLPTLFFVRHGETEWNATGRLQGGTEIGLNDRGRHQAATAGRILGRLRPDAATLDFVASPMLRTRQTMELLRGALGLPAEGYRTDPRLVELSFGDWEGLTWPEVQAKAPEGAAARERDTWNYEPPGGESYERMRARAAPVFTGLTRDTVIVSHGGVCRAMLTLLCGLAEEAAPDMLIEQGRVLLVENGRWRWV